MTILLLSRTKTADDFNTLQRWLKMIVLVLCGLVLGFWYGRFGRRAFYGKYKEKLIALCSALHLVLGE